MLGTQIYTHLMELSKISAPGEGVTRLYLSEEHRRANDYISTLMRSAGLECRVDQLANVIGRYNSTNNSHSYEDTTINSQERLGIRNLTKKKLMLASHQDSVVKGGAFDGPLGIILAIHAFEAFLDEVDQVNFDIIIAAFGDEEGVRYGLTYTGSKGITGNFKQDYLNLVDEHGVSFSEALRNFGLDPSKVDTCKINDIDDYVEIHIEQGPVLEHHELSVGVVTDIQASHRYKIKILGVAGHAGTVPMHLRSDAGLIAFKSIVELDQKVRTTESLVATVGRLSLIPGSINVIPSEAHFTLDIRSSEERHIHRIVHEYKKLLQNLCNNKENLFHIECINQSPSTHCDDILIDLLKTSSKLHQSKALLLPSGAGHDAQEMCHICQVAMLFVRCKEGISHNPKEDVNIADIEIAAQTIKSFLHKYNAMHQ